MPTCIPEFLRAHWMVIGSVSGYIGLTLARHLPKPGQPMSAYEYFYDVLQSLLAAPAIKSFEARVAPGDVVVTATGTDKTGSITIK